MSSHWVGVKGTNEGVAHGHLKEGGLCAFGDIHLVVYSRPISFHLSVSISCAMD